MGADLDKLPIASNASQDEFWMKKALALAEKLCPEISELPPFQVVDGDIVVLMDGTDEAEGGHP